MCDLTVTRLGDDAFLVVTGGAVGKHDLAWMRRHLPGDGSVHLEDQTSSSCCIGVWGPRARDLVASVSEDYLSNEAFPYMTMRELHIGSVPVRALRISYVGELGWEIYAPTEFGLALWDTLWEAGAPFEAVACGGGAYDSLRIEKGYRLWGADIDEEHDPYEAGLGKEPILDGERTLGYVTSAGWGATVEESIAYGYLPVEHSKVGTRVSIHSEGRREEATVADEPLFDPTMARLRDIAPAAAR
jgi:glycine cleavage system aminomethyltransferase T